MNYAFYFLSLCPSLLFKHSHDFNELLYVSATSAHLRASLIFHWRRWKHVLLFVSLYEYVSATKVSLTLGFRRDFQTLLTRCVCLYFRPQNTNLPEIRYEHHTANGKSVLIISNSLSSKIPIWRQCELVNLHVRYTILIHIVVTGR